MKIKIPLYRLLGHQEMPKERVISIQQEPLETLVPWRYMALNLEQLVEVDVDPISSKSLERAEEKDRLP